MTGIYFREEEDLGRYNQMKLLIVIDMQNDFIDGALGTAEAAAIVPKVIAKIKGFDGTVLATQDTHYENYLTTQEGKNLPVPHCIVNTEGWQIRKEIADLISTEPIIKETFGSSRFQLENHIQHLFRKGSALFLIRKQLKALPLSACVRISV